MTPIIIYLSHFKLTDYFAVRFLFVNRKLNTSEQRKKWIHEKIDMYHLGDNYKWGNEIDLTGMSKLFDWFYVDFNSFLFSQSGWIWVSRKPYPFIGRKIHANKSNAPTPAAFKIDVIKLRTAWTNPTLSQLNYLISIMPRDIIIHSFIHSFIDTVWVIYWRWCSFFQYQFYWHFTRTHTHYYTVTNKQEKKQFQIKFRE